MYPFGWYSDSYDHAHIPVVPYTPAPTPTSVWDTPTSALDTVVNPHVPYAAHRELTPKERFPWLRRCWWALVGVLGFLLILQSTFGLVLLLAVNYNTNACCFPSLLESVYQQRRENGSWAVAGHECDWFCVSPDFTDNADNLDMHQNRQLWCEHKHRNVTRSVSRSCQTACGEFGRNSGYGVLLLIVSVPVLDMSVHVVSTMLDNHRWKSPQLASKTSQKTFVGGVVVFALLDTAVIILGAVLINLPSGLQIKSISKCGERLQHLTEGPDWSQSLIVAEIVLAVITLGMDLVFATVTGLSLYFSHLWH
eukprot:TRINITY_DN75574_c0_g1_i1.p1 TRINITY_DN75574_c0_g1~~TRINITY_DN75574_c0_g1_i1.p1  ORF type:complete len:308 (+),score=1.40 TRINITY_DN75574_c0_g1_i1:78-1001(+)